MPQTVEKLAIKNGYIYLMYNNYVYAKQDDNSNAVNHFCYGFKSRSASDKLKNTHLCTYICILVQNSVSVWALQLHTATVIVHTYIN